jgi:hypothetical protein
MVVLADEGLETAEPVGVTGSPGLDLDVEVTAEQCEVTLERGGPRSERRGR